MRMSLMLCLVVGTLQSFVQLIQQEVTSDKDFLPSNLNDVFHFIIQLALHVTAQVQIAQKNFGKMYARMSFGSKYTQSQNTKEGKKHKEKK